MIVIPAIDLRGGRCVRLAQGDFARQTDYPDDPRALAERYAGAGATRLHVVDLDGAKAGRPAQSAAIARLATALGVEVQAGGGVRRAGDVEALLAAGVARVVIGSVAVREPDRIARWLERFGPARLVIALDVREVDGDWRVATAGWTRTEAVTLDQALEPLVAAGAGTVLCTDIGRDGMLSGPSVGLYRALARAWPGLEIQASGGVGSLEDLAALAAVPVAGAIVGKALLDGRFGLAEAIAAAREAA